MAIVRYVLAKLKPGVGREEYEKFEREVDYVVAGRLKTIVSYRTHRITAADPRLAGGRLRGRIGGVGGRHSSQPMPVRAAAPLAAGVALLTSGVDHRLGRCDDRPSAARHAP